MLDADVYGRIVFGWRADTRTIRKKFKNYKNNPTRIADATTADDVKLMFVMLDRWDKDSKLLRDDLLKTTDIQEGD